MTFLRLWILDTGRALTPNGTLVNAAYGGPKLVAVWLANNTIADIIVFPTTAAYPDSASLVSVLLTISH